VHYPFPPVGDEGDAERSGIGEYARMLWHRRLTVVIVMVVCVGLTLAYSSLAPTTYEATTSVLIEPALSNTLLEANFPTGTGLVADVPDSMALLTSPAVADAVRQQIPDAPAAQVSEVGTTDVVKITTKAKSPSLAAATANAYATTFIRIQRAQTVNTFVSAQQLLNSRIDELQGQIDSLNRTIRSSPPSAALIGNETRAGTFEEQLAKLQDQLATYQFYGSVGVANEGGQIISMATAPTAPSSPKPVRYTLIALLVGLLLGVVAAFVVTALSTRGRRT